jgi:carboxymethylenebutenolidase
MGGVLALHAACALPDAIGACVDYYGLHPTVQPDLATLRAPVLGLFGAHDAFVPPDAAHALAADVARHGGRFDAHTVDAGHAFFDDSRPDSYVRDAARDAWQRTLAFLAANC